jgi:hypothetical protein
MRLDVTDRNHAKQKLGYRDPVSDGLLRNTAWLPGCISAGPGTVLISHRLRLRPKCVFRWERYGALHYRQAPAGPQDLHNQSFYAKRRGHSSGRVRAFNIEPLSRLGLRKENFVGLSCLFEIQAA